MTSRALFTIGSDRDRRRIIDLAGRVPVGTRVEFKREQRSLDQNKALWASLTDVAEQVMHGGRHYTTDQWKVLFLHALGREVQFLPALEGGGFVPYGKSSSDLSRGEMGELLDFIESWGAAHGVTFTDPDTLSRQGEVA